MNKYKTQETFCYTFISMWVIGVILLMMTSCSNYKETVKLNKKTGIYHQVNQYEPWRHM